MSRRRNVGPTADAVREAVGGLAENAITSGLTPHRRRKLEGEIRDVISELGDLLRQLDPIAEPAAVFDPANPKLVGRFVALALVAQPRCPLESIPQFYGSGIYALYYRGSFPDYASISGTETPIYVGTASPAVANARNPFEQGDRLIDRIGFHARNIAKATSTLSLGDFEFRSLVVQSGWEKQAESYLIHLFRPVWNKETRILQGFGKHGDSAKMRQHGRSPWDTFHPARGWAGESETDQKSPELIREELQAHFRRHPPYEGVGQVLEDFFEELSQAVSR